MSVRVVADLIFDDVGDSPAITVESGGSLEATATDATGRITLQVRRVDAYSGLLCESGSTCLLHGGYRQIGSATPALQPSLEAAGFAEVGEYLPCPGWDDSADRWLTDCAGALSDPDDLPGTVDEVGFIYPHAVFGAEGEPGPNDRYVADSLSAMAPTDLLCFGDPDVTTPAAPVDDGFCYEVVAVDGSHDLATDGVGYLIIDVRQTNPQRPKETTYPLSLRTVKEGVVQAATVSGANLLEVDDAFIDCTVECRDTSPWLNPDGVADRERVGMWLRFAEPDGTPSAVSQRISRTFDDPADGSAPIDCSQGPCDLIEVFDRDGFPADVSAGARFWVDYGHAPGETFFVIVPVRFASPPDVQPIFYYGRAVSTRLGAELGLRAVLIDDASKIAATLTHVQAVDIVLRDATGGGLGNGSAFSIGGADEVRLTRISFTGGNIGQYDQVHALTIGSHETPVEAWIHTVKGRHIGDDFLSTGAAVNFNQLERLEAQWVTPVAASCQLISQNENENTFVGDCKACACVDCASNEFSAVYGSVSGVGAESQMTFDGFLRWGMPGPFSYVSGSGVRVHDLLRVGGDHRLPEYVDGFVVALVDHPGGGGGSSALTDAHNLDVRNGIVRDYERAQSPIMAAQDDGVLHNVALIDVQPTIDCTSSTCAAIVVGNSPAGSDYNASNVSVVVRPGSSSQLDFGVLTVENENRSAFDGLLVSGLDVSTEKGIAIGGKTPRMANLFSENTGTSAPGAPLTRGPCLVDNTASVEPGREGTLPASTVEGVAPGFVDPSVDRFDPIPGGVADLADCGVRGGAAAPGIKRYRYLHAMTRTDPELMADDDDGDGFPTDPSGPVCAGGDTRHCADNCLGLFNPDQLDSDGSGVGDLCNDALDADADEFEDDIDNCTGTPNPGQEDADHDGVGDACDGVADLADLQVENVTGPSEVDLSAKFEVSAQLVNAGLGSEGPVPVGLTLYLAPDVDVDPVSDLLMGACLALQPNPGLTVGCAFANLQVVDQGAVPTGAHYVVCADETDAISETDETNNCALGTEVTISVPEPAAVLLHGFGVSALGLLHRRRRARSGLRRFARE